MVSPTNTLFVAQSAIRASQAGIHTVGQNISNVNTPGYHRRELRQTTANPRLERGHYVGQGVDIIGAQRIIDSNINERRRTSISGSEAATVRSEVMLRAEGIFGDLEGLGVTQAVDRLFASFDYLAGQPESSLARSQVLQAAEGFSRSVSSRAHDLRLIREDLNGVVNDQVDTVNQILGELASLNGKIRSVNAPPNDLLDRREALLDELSEHIQTKVIFNADETVDVMSEESFPLVMGDRVNALQTSVNALGLVDVLGTDGGGTHVISGRITGGTLGGALQARDVDIANTLADLDQFVFDLANAVNTVHAGGFGLDGVTGRNLFNVSAVVPGAAEALTLDAAVAGNTDAVAAATNLALLPGDNTNALALSDVRTQGVMTGGVEPGEFLANILSDFGDRVYQNNLEMESRGFEVRNLTELKESISGVSLDEEMMTLLRYREAFTAATQVAKTADEMLMSILNIKR